jgi:hypothetical protein
MMSHDEGVELTLLDSISLCFVQPCACFPPCHLLLFPPCACLVPAMSPCIVLLPLPVSRHVTLYCFITTACFPPCHLALFYYHCLFPAIHVTLYCFITTTACQSLPAHHCHWPGTASPVITLSMLTPTSGLVGLGALQAGGGQRWLCGVHECHR